MKGSVLQEDVIVGQNTFIGENSNLINVSLGSNCELGANVYLCDCIIHDNVRIGPNCQLKGSIVGQDVVIGANVFIQDKCVIGPGVRLKDDCNSIGPLTWLVSKKPSDGFDNDSEAKVSEISQLGPSAFCYKQDADNTESDSEEEDEDKGESGDYLEYTWGLLESSEKDDEESSSLSDDDSDDFPLIDETVTKDIINDDDAKFDRFHCEVLESLQRGFEDVTEISNLVLEVNASRHAYAVTAKEVVHSVIISVLTIANMSAKKSDDLTPAKLLCEVKCKLKFFEKMIQNYVKSESSRLDCMKSIEKYCWKEENFLPITPKIVHFMYQELDILSEKAILEWYYSENDDDISITANEANEIASTTLRKKLTSLIEWLEDSEEEEDEY